MVEHICNLGIRKVETARLLVLAGQLVQPVSEPDSVRPPKQAGYVLRGGHSKLTSGLHTGTKRCAHLHTSGLVTSALPTAASLQA